MQQVSQVLKVHQESKDSLVHQDQLELQGPLEVLEPQDQWALLV